MQSISIFLLQIIVFAFSSLYSYLFLFLIIGTFIYYFIRKKTVHFPILLIGLYFVLSSLAGLLLWAYFVSHGHLFECFSCWLSETTYLRHYLPKMGTRIILENASIAVILIVVNRFFLQRFKKMHRKT